MITHLQSPLFEGALGLSHGFFGRTGGVSEGVYASLNAGVSTLDARDAIAENRARIAQILGVAADRFMSCHQVHSPDVVVVDQPFDVFTACPDADAMVTRQKGIALGALSADCVPVLFYAPHAGVIGAAHAGWRGAVGGVLDSTVSAMENLGAERPDIRAAIGPAIWQDSYEVGPTYPEPFLAEDPENSRYFKPSARAGHFMFDLPAYVVDRLRRIGVGTVMPSLANTAGDDGSFFSYRRNCLNGTPKTGCQVSAIMLAG